VKNARFTGFRILADAQMPLSAGIVLVNSDVQVEDNEVAGAGIGVEIRGAASPLLRANAIHDCAGEGILISGASAPWLSHNAIQRNGRAGWPRTMARIPRWSGMCSRRTQWSCRPTPTWMPCGRGISFLTRNRGGEAPSDDCARQPQAW